MSGRSRAVPSRSKRSRSRKRRPQATGSDERDRQEIGGGVEATGRGAEAIARGSGAGARGARPKDGPPETSAIPTFRSYGERPRPPWHPLPLSELLILVGAIGLIVGFRRGPSFGGTTMLAGLIAVALGTLEVTLREHRSGYRSHTIMLAALPVVIFHSVVALGLSMFTTVPPVANVGIFAVDLALFALLFRLARARFLTARTRVAGRR